MFKVINKIIFAFLSVAMTLSYLFFILPRKGVSFGDEGYYLYSAMAFAKGFKPDILIPLAPFGIFNAVFVLLGVRTYIAFRYLYVVFVLVSGTVFLKGLFSIDSVKEYRRNIVLFLLTSTIFLFSSVSTIFSYTNAPVMFLMMGTGICFYGADKKFFNIYCLLSGLMFALSAFVNMSVIPAAGLTVLCLLWLYRSQKNIFLLLVSFVGSFVLLLSYYLICIGGVDKLFGLAEVHSMSHFLGRLQVVLIVFGGPFVAFFMLFLLMKFINKFVLKKYKQEIEVAIFSCGFVSILVYCLLVFAQFCFGADLYASLNLEFLRVFLQKFNPILWNLYSRQVFAFISLVLFSFSIVFGYIKNVFYYRLLWVSFFVACYSFLQVFASATDMFVSLMFYSGIMVVLSILFLVNKLKTYNVSNKLFIFFCNISIFLIFLLLLLYQLNANFSHTYFRDAKNEINAEKLEGLFDSSYKKQLFERLTKIYYENDGDNKAFIAQAVNPIWYYLFEREAPGKSSHILPIYNWPEKEMLSYLESSPGWVVFWSANYRSHADWKTAKKVQDYLIENSMKIIYVGRDTDNDALFEGNSNYIVYLK